MQVDGETIIIYSVSCRLRIGPRPRHLIPPHRSYLQAGAYDDLVIYMHAMIAETDQRYAEETKYKRFVLSLHFQ